MILDGFHETETDKKNCFNLRTEVTLTLFSKPRADIYGVTGEMLHGTEH